MNAKFLSLLAIALWLVTAGVFITKFVGGDTKLAQDGRTAVVLTESQRDFVLMEMRQLLGAVNGVIGGLAKGDSDAVEQAARAQGLAAPRSAPAELMMKLPLGFKRTGMSVHKGMDALADAAASGASSTEIMGMLHGQLSTCVGCHETYRLTAETP